MAAKTGPAAPWLRAFGWTCAGLSVAVALFSYRYLVGVGPISPNVFANLFRRPWLDLHVAGAATALLVGPSQLLGRRRGVLHRIMGRVYVIGCLLGGVAGFILALGSIAGPAASLGFGLLAIGWISTTVLGWRAAVQRRLDVHRAWMIRSFALTFAAVTLRLYLLPLPWLPVSGLAAFRVIAFACWIPNLIVTEVYLRRAR